MLYISEAPDDSPICTDSIFLAGGISNCYNWQSEFIDLLYTKVSNYWSKYVDVAPLLHSNMSSYDDESYIIYNPRRKHFDTSNKEVEREQITWEFDRLNAAENLVFWFPKETVCPITLFEYGKALGQYASDTSKQIYVGYHEEYSRKNDLVIQTELMIKSLKNNSNIRYPKIWMFHSNFNALVGNVAESFID